MSETDIPCPFVYANGKQCSGHVSGWRLYGGLSINTARKVRLWCSEKFDHEGSVFNGKSKRMEFYPDRLPEVIYRAVASDPR